MYFMTCPTLFGERKTFLPWSTSAERTTDESSDSCFSNVDVTFKGGA